MKLGALFFVAAMIVLPGTASSAPRATILDARPSAGAGTLPAGETRLANGAVAYRPAAAPAGALPLVVLLHGAGGYPPHFLQMMEPAADKRGVILLAPRSLGVTWDLVEKMQSADDPWGGPDANRIDEALQDLFGRASIDPSRIVLLGFSDGASYALSLGLSNPRLFTSVVALSPGMYAPPRRVDKAQLVYIAHGRSDRILRFSNTEAIVERLRDDRAKLRFHPFDGDHRIDKGALAEALDWTLGGGASGSGLQQ